MTGIANSPVSGAVRGAASGGGAGGSPSLVITVQPVGSLSGSPLSTMPELQARTAGGSLDTSFNGLVTATLNGTGVITLGSTATGVNGNIAFTNTRITGAGNCTLTFSAATYTSATSITVTTS